MGCRGGGGVSKEKHIGTRDLRTRKRNSNRGRRGIKTRSEVKKLVRPLNGGGKGEKTETWFERRRERKTRVIVSSANWRPMPRNSRRITGGRLDGRRGNTGLPLTGRRKQNQPPRRPKRGKLTVNKTRERATLEGEVRNSPEGRGTSLPLDEGGSVPAAKMLHKGQKVGEKGPLRGLPGAEGSILSGTRRREVAQGVWRVR